MAVNYQDKSFITLAPNVQMHNLQLSAYIFDTDDNWGAMVA